MLTLSPAACHSSDTRGRKVFEEECEFRTAFRRDRDRIIHSSAFRRLKHKTQVFLIPKSEHYRTRLAHTLEVSQIARTIASALELNEDLAEAIALGHDLGHTPFGHDGEEVLNNLVPGGFRHNEQSVRVAEKIEKNGKGLNLTEEVLDGMLNHRGGGQRPLTLEGQAVRFADKIAYINHDIEDAIRGGVITESDLPINAARVLGHGKGERITRLIRSLAQNSGDDLAFDSATKEAHDELRSFLFENVYRAIGTNAERQRAMRLVESLYHYYVDNTELLSGVYREILAADGAERAVCDFIAGMTDDYAVAKFKELFIPKEWNDEKLTT
jgi:dGTPase